MIPENDSKTDKPSVERIFDQLNAIDFTLAQLQIALKDPDERQEIGVDLVKTINDAITHKGIEFADVKVKSKGGMATVSFKFAASALAKSN
jgi:hypothetical protein